MRKKAALAVSVMRTISLLLFVIAFCPHIFIDDFVLVVVILKAIGFIQLVAKDDLGTSAIIL